MPMYDSWHVTWSSRINQFDNSNSKNYYRTDFILRHVEILVKNVSRYQVPYSLEYANVICGTFLIKIHFKDLNKKWIIMF